MKETNTIQPDKARGFSPVLMNTRQAAAAFSVSPSTIRAWMKAGCPVVYIGKACSGRGSRPRFEAAAVRSWLDTIQPAGV